MISKFQFDTVSELIDAGVTSYVQVRQQVGLTSEELDDIIENLDYYKAKFAEEERLKQEATAKKKHWWQR